jgi:hypothetical protein
MSFGTFILTFWPLLIIYSIAFIGAPVLLAIVLTRFERRREVRQMHRARHGENSSRGCSC